MTAADISLLGHIHVGVREKRLRLSAPCLLPPRSPSLLLSTKPPP